MAQLTKDGLTLEIYFAKVVSGWINYEIYFKWQGISIINPQILWAGKAELGKEEALFANDAKEELIATIDRVLANRKASSWQPLEPAITLAFYPGTVFPFIRTPLTDLIEKLPGKKAEPAEKADLVGIEQPDLSLDPSLIQIIIRVSTFNFKGEGTYGDDGIALHMVVEDWQLYNFVKELKQEYKAFLIQYKDELCSPDDDE